MTFDLSKNKQEIKYYYSKEGSSIGPFNVAQLLEKIDGETMVYREGIEWTNAKNIDELKKFFKEVTPNKVQANVIPEENQKKRSLDGHNDQNKKSTFVSSSETKNKKKPLLIVLVILLLAIPAVYFLRSDTFNKMEEVDLFRKIDGEVQVFVNNLILRQYPDSKSTKIETFPMGTRLIFDENEYPKSDDKNRTWRKVRVIHPLYGWDKPDERFPYPYEGWMATDECGIAWLEDSLSTANLSRILGNEDAGRSVTSNYRHGLLDYFKKKGYFDEWVIYGSDKKAELQLVILNKFGNSSKDCNNNDQFDFITILHNKQTNDKKLLVLSLNDFDNYTVVYDEKISSNDSFDSFPFGDILGIRKLTTSEKRKFNRTYNSSISNPVLIVFDYNNLVIGIENGELSTFSWHE